MQRLLIVFHDGELLYAETPSLHFELPVLEAEIANIDSNSERAILPLAAIRMMIVGDISAAPPPAVLQDAWDRAAFHFLDGAVMRAWVGPDVLLGAHGGIWPVVELGGEELRRLAIPYSSLKGVFRLRKWDSRPLTERAAREAGASIQLEHMVRVLAEREVRAGTPAPPPRGGLLHRVRDGATAPPAEAEAEAEAHGAGGTAAGGAVAPPEGATSS